MRKIEVSELRRELSTVLAELPLTGSVEITRYGRVIATLGKPPVQTRSAKPKISGRRLRRICQRHHIERLALFGSILRDDFGPDSDIDVLVDPKPGCMKTLAERVAAETDLAKLFCRQIDLVKRVVIEASTNEVRRRSILDTAEVIYEAR